MYTVYIKQRNRENPTFANINLLGTCNVDCFFCLGKDISEYLTKYNQLSVHYDKWNNFEKFLDGCRENNISKIYITGQNTDSLLYKYLDEIVDFLQDNDFNVGLRTNGYRALKMMDVINRCNLRTGYSIHTLDSDINKMIMGRDDIPDWDSILNKTNKCRVAIVINRYNIHEFFPLVDYISRYKSVSYIQARRISTDTRLELLEEDMILFERLYDTVEKYYQQYKKKGIHGAQTFNWTGKDVVFWRTVGTTVSSFNYFTDGTISNEYFIVEGYLKNRND